MPDLPSEGFDISALFAEAVALRAAGDLGGASAKAELFALLCPEEEAAHELVMRLAAARGDVPALLASARETMNLTPHSPRALADYANACLMVGEWREAERAAGHALRSDAHFAPARWVMALCLLRRGDFGPGFRQYRAGACAGVGTRPLRTFEPPAAGDDPDATVYLWAEQGFGDTLMMSRFAASVTGRAARTVLEVQPALYPLLRCLPPSVASRVVPGVSEGFAEPWDDHCSLMDLPGALGLLAPEDIPPPLPLRDHLPPEASSPLPKAPGERWLGLCWRGSGAHRMDAARSIAPEAFAEAVKAMDLPEGVRLVSLQRGEADGMAEGLPWRGLQVATPCLSDWRDAARAVLACDAVLSVDTAVLHLAGTLGVPSVALLSTAHDWRWLDGDNPDWSARTPWYPCVRLARQRHFGEWGDAFAAARRFLLPSRPEEGFAGVL